jgi:parvulin-like peptidyl-prolyl isomerase
MSFRNRPVLNRKHRPRWQDELRTQQLILAGFALAIAVAIGIFAATAWSDHYDTHLRPVAAVGDLTYTADDLYARTDIIGSELSARYDDLASQLGGVRDPLIQQGLQAIQDAFTSLGTTTADNLVLGRILTESAGRFGITVSDAAVTAEVKTRQTLNERLKLSLISIAALPKDAKAGATPTDADWARAQTDIQGILAALQGGADFATTAKDKSGDPSASSGGALGWVQADDQVYGTYFTEAKDAAKGDLVGPTKDDSGYHILRLDDRRASAPNQPLLDLLSKSGVSDAAYRAYVHESLLQTAFKDHFSTTVMTAYQPARHVAQIFISAQQGVPVAQQRLRHFLAQPLPGEADQSKATDAQWAAALARAEAFRTAAGKPDADWFTLALQSDDTGSRSRGGDLGWYDPASSNFVPEFKAALVGLSVGELSEPVKTQFGYHVIQITGTRITPADQAAQLVTTLRQDPAKFAQLARQQSEDGSTASKGGDLGWVIRYQLDKTLSDVVFALSAPDQISDPIETTNGLYIFKLIDSSPARWVPTSRLDQVRQSGFSKWLAEIRAAADTWIDPQFVAAPTSG